MGSLKAIHEQETLITTDVLVCDHGTAAILFPMTEPGRGVVCEPRYVGAIIDGLIADGLEVSLC